MIQYYPEAERLLVAVDSIILGFEEGRLKILVGRRKREPGAGELSLYGGFVRKEENLRDAAYRVLHELTGIKDIYMRQVGTFGKINRDPGDRVISVVYCALINVADYNSALLDRYGLTWIDLSERPTLWGDHEEMVKLAISQLRQNVTTDPLCVNLLPKLFTLTQLQNCYEAILGYELDKRNFRKHIKQFAYIEKTALIDKLTSKRGAVLYRFNQRIYKQTSGNLLK